MIFFSVIIAFNIVYRILFLTTSELEDKKSILLISERI